MTIDEAIDGLKRIFSNYELDLPCTDSLDIESEIIVLLEELKALKNNSISIEAFERMKSKSYKKGHRQGYNKALDDIVTIIKERVGMDWEWDFCFIEQIAEQLKAGEMNEYNI